MPPICSSGSSIPTRRTGVNFLHINIEDIDVTRRLIQAGELLEIEVLDHLIIGQGAWMSMREQQLCW